MTDYHPTVSPMLLSHLSDIIALQIGLHFPKKRWRDLERSISSAAKEFGFEDVVPCIEWLLSSPLTRKQIEILACHLTVGETYFFRDPGYFKIVEENILPEFIGSRRGKVQYLRIWSAGCATGEEAYSVAILLDKILYDRIDWDITILATDINRRFLRKATDGLYSAWSFRNVPSWVKEKYFKQRKNGRFEIFPRIREMVTFSYHNLAEDPYPSLQNDTYTMDIIFCRNVLMYFAQARAEEITKNLSHSLAGGGWLIVSPTETCLISCPDLLPVNFTDAILYKRAVSLPQKLPDTREQKPPVPRVEVPGKKDISPLHPASPLPRLSLAPRSRQGQAQIGERGGRDALPVNHRNDLPGESRVDVQTGCPPIKKRGAPIPALILPYQTTEFDTISEAPTDVTELTRLARELADRGKLTEAAECCKKAIASNKLNPALHYLLATVLQEQGLTEEAVKTARQVLYLDQDFVPAYFILGILTRMQGKVKESERHFENALKLLERFNKEDILPGTEGITAGRLVEIVTSTMERKRADG
jgi:chemotaxis protein methyltransferase CheR